MRRMLPIVLAVSLWPSTLRAQERPYFYVWGDFDVSGWGNVGDDASKMIRVWVADTTPEDAAAQATLIAGNQILAGETASVCFLIQNFGLPNSINVCFLDPDDILTHPVNWVNSTTPPDPLPFLQPWMDNQQSLQGGRD